MLGIVSLCVGIAGGTRKKVRKNHESWKSSGKIKLRPSRIPVLAHSRWKAAEGSESEDKEDKPKMPAEIRRKLQREIKHLEKREAALKESGDLL